MSFSGKVKEELTTLKSTTSETLAVLSGFVRNNGFIKDDDLYLSTESDKVAEMLKKYIKYLYNIDVKIEKKDNLNLYKNKLNEIKIEEKTYFILNDLGVLDKNKRYIKKVPEYIVDGNEEIRSYLRGAFISSGSINDPESSYHLEFTINKKEEAVFVQHLLNIFDLNAKILARDKGYMVYIKEAERISDFLKLIHANSAVMHYENVRVYHEEKNKTNRLNNCEQANTDKIVASGMKELEDIKLIEDKITLDALDDKLLVAATYRKKYPEASLKELSKIIEMEAGVKITKSGLNHRFRKIKEISDKFR